MALPRHERECRYIPKRNRCPWFRYTEPFSGLTMSFRRLEVEMNMRMSPLIALAITLVLFNFNSGSQAYPADESEEVQILACFLSFATSDQLSKRLEQTTPRCRMNAIASTLYGQIRRGHLDSVNELLTKFAVEGLSIPPPADQTMSPRDLEKLRLDQWMFMKALIEKLGNRQLQFADELNAIHRIPNPRPNLTEIRISEDGRLATAYTVPGSLQIELKFVKENGKWLLDGANRPDYYELIPKLNVISK